MAPDETSEAQRSPHELIENRPRAAGRQCLLVRISHLTEQLFLGHHRGVEARDHLEHATHGFGASVLARWRSLLNVNGYELDAMARLNQHGLGRRKLSEALSNSCSLIRMGFPKRGEAHLDAFQRGRMRQADGHRVGDQCRTLRAACPRRQM
jgi:hypothetical protein